METEDEKNWRKISARLVFVYMKELKESVSVLDEKLLPSTQYPWERPDSDAHVEIMNELANITMKVAYFMGYMSSAVRDTYKTHTDKGDK